MKIKKPDCQRFFDSSERKPRIFSSSRRTPSSQSIDLARCLSSCPMVSQSCFAWAWILERIILQLFFQHPSSHWLGDLLLRAAQVDQKFGKSVKLIQSFAVLEVVHAALKLVRSGLLTTSMQVSSRLWIVWGILPTFPQLGSSPVYASMVLAWSFTEVIRYAHYTFGLANIQSDVLEWLRYSTFYVLYPLGAGSEALVMFFAFQAAKAAQLEQFIVNGILGLVCLWPPALAVMMKHMARQRKKYLQKCSKSSKMQ
ncbi:hypothetical protein O181_005632 [Austropuccinia psidii MF-1]|uniref:Very-long-chain (3R)-3-hydroxyacyl-CoA dehydratase n=1 Tax=Austropuccinia psidii MF-1 TaxID=1389203 RepID=A0A9Q3BJ46_9BASI|nr:hypothetical protein [Austropuccinia psidii MF-1]